MANNKLVLTLALNEAKRISLEDAKGEVVVGLFNNDLEEPEFTCCPESNLKRIMEMEPYLTEAFRFLNGEKIS